MLQDHLELRILLVAGGYSRGALCNVALARVASGVFQTSAQHDVQLRLVAISLKTHLMISKPRQLALAMIVSHQNVGIAEDI
jgi:hypothetical protein